MKRSTLKKTIDSTIANTRTSHSFTIPKTTAQEYDDLAKFFFKLRKNAAAQEILELKNIRQTKGVFPRHALDKAILVFCYDQNKKIGDADIFNSLARIAFLDLDNNLQTDRSLNLAFWAEKVNSTSYLLSAAMGFNRKSYSIMKTLEIAERKDNKDYLAYIYLGNYADEYCPIEGKRRNDFLRQMVRQMRKNDEFEEKITDFKKATSKIKILGGGHLLSNSIIIKENDYSFRKEVKNNKRLKKRITGINLPKLICKFKKEGKHYLVMERERGMTLTNYIKEAHSGNSAVSTIIDQIYSTILDNITNIHAQTPMNKRKYNFCEKINNKTTKGNFSPLFNEGIRTIGDELNKTSNWCYNNDSSTDNWLVFDGGGTPKITLLDTEDRYSVPCAMELAQFLNCIPFLSPEEQISKVKSYAENFNSKVRKKRMIKDIDDFIFEFCKATVYRSFANYCYAYSKPEETNRGRVLEAGINMVDFMKRSSIISSSQSKMYEEVRNGLVQKKLDLEKRL